MTNGIHAPRRPTRHPVPERRLWLPLLVTILLIAGGCAVGLARAQEATEDAWVISQEAAALVPTPTATPEPEPTRYVPSGRGSRPAVRQWRPLLEQYPWDVEQALRVLDCESGGNPAVWNRQGSGAHGLFQLLGWEAKAYELYGVWSVADPVVNVGVAYWIWSASGGTFGTSMGWSSSRGCWS